VQEFHDDNCHLRRNIHLSCFDFIKSTSSQANREEVFAEHQRKKINHKEEVRREYKKTEAEKLLARQVRKEGSRKTFMDYRIDIECFQLLTIGN